MDKLDRIKVYIFLFLFTLLFIGEFLIKQITHSVLILVDSYYNLFQICTLIFIFIDHKTSDVKSIRATFGYARLSVLGGLISHTFFGALAFALVVESMQLILHTTHEVTTIKPYLNLFAAIISISVQSLSCGLIIRLLNKETNKFSISGPNVQMHFVVRSKGDTLEHVTIGEQQANSMILNPNKQLSDKEKINQNDQIKNNNNKCKKNSCTASMTDSSSKKNLRNSSFISTLDGSHLKEFKQNKTLQKQLTLRVFRNFISSTFLIINSIIGCALFKFKPIDLDTIDTALKMLDPISALISIIILSLLVYPEVKQSGLVLLQSLPSYIEIDTLKRKLIKRFPMIFEIHELHVWCLNTQKVIATCHIKLKHHFKSTEHFGEWLEELQSFFKAEGIDQATIQPEFICTNPFKSESSSSTLNDENENALLKRVPSCLLKCNSNSSTECEKNTCCHLKTEIESKENSNQNSTKPDEESKEVL